MDRQLSPTLELNPAPLLTFIKCDSSPHTAASLGLFLHIKTTQWHKMFIDPLLKRTKKKNTQQSHWWRHWAITFTTQCLRDKYYGSRLCAFIYCEYNQLVNQHLRRGTIRELLTSPGQIDILRKSQNVLTQLQNTWDSQWLLYQRCSPNWIIFFQH